ncbi:MAG: hypothetical protein WBM40_16800 [Thiohalocapsa sp.]
MRNRPRHSPRARLLLTLAALGSLLVGYYLGQYWQRQPLDQLSAIVFEDGKPIELPGSLVLTTPAEPPVWRLFVAVDSQVDACRSAMRQFAFMMNRLAAWPKIQARVRVTALAFDNPSVEQAEAFAGGTRWVEAVNIPKPQLERLVDELGIQPDTAQWCVPTQLNGILVAPDSKRWALIPYEDPETMAYNVQAVIQFVE